MGIGEILETILKEAEEKASKIKKEAEAQAQDILDKANREADNKRQVLLEQAKKEIDTEVKAIISSANLEKRKIILQAKKEIIEEVFRILLEKINPERLPKIKKVFRDRIVEEPLNREDFLKNIKEDFEGEVSKLLNLDEEAF